MTVVAVDSCGLCGKKARQYNHVLMLAMIHVCKFLYECCEAFHVCYHLLRFYVDLIGHLPVVQRPGPASFLNVKYATPVTTVTWPDTSSTLCLIVLMTYSGTCGRLQF